MESFEQNNQPHEERMPQFRRAEMDINPQPDERPIPETPMPEMNTPPVQEPSPRPVFTPPAYTQSAYSQPVYERPVYAPPQPPVYRGEGVGRREATYADTSYGQYYQPTAQFGGGTPNACQPQPQNLPPKKKEKKKKEKKAGKGGLFKTVVAAVLVLATVAGSCGATFVLVNKHWEKRTAQMNATYDQKINSLQTQVNAAVEAAADAADAAIAAGGSHSGSPAAVAGSLTPGQVYARNKNSVVLINCEILSGQRVVGASAGSGFIVTENGFVVTNYHVVDGGTRITVTTANGSQYDATYVGGDESNDFAMLKIADESIEKPLQPVTLGKSDDLIVGDQVVAIGNPLGELTSTLTVGYISAKERDVSTSGVAINMLQTDAAINSGNSGGPLFNMKGEVIGITSAKYSGTSSSGATIEGIGFAIPIDDVRSMLTDLMEYGYITGAYLGVMVGDVNPEAVQYYGVPMGAYVSEVSPGYCAEKGGIQAKDIITDVGGHPVEGLSDLTRALRNFKAGDTVQITVYRAGQTITLTVTLGEKPQDTEEPTPDVPSGNMPENGNYDEWYEYFYPYFGD